MLKKPHNTIVTIGAGSWGTALSILLAKNGHTVHLCGRNIDHMRLMEDRRCNPIYLPEVEFPENLHPSSDLAAAVARADIILIALPSSAFRQCLQQLAPLLTAKHSLIWASKGLEPMTNQLLHHVIAEEIKLPIKSALLSGPSFAKEVALGLPTAVVIATKDAKYGEVVINLFANKHFRPYYTNDIIGAEVGGTVKNVLAIAAGISDGLGFGANARAALITRGLSEITRLGLALGARPETFMGLSGLGDLILTSADNQSRNRRFGLALGRGLSITEALTEIGQVVEGAENVKQVLALAAEKNIDMPITHHVSQVLAQKISPQQAVEFLFSRDLKDE